jgi:predicted dehydrogenase
VYLEQLRAAPEVDVVALADRDPARSQARAAEFGVRAAPSAEAVIHDETVELVVILTPPESHAELAQQCVTAGKHVYVEKPLAIGLPSAYKLIAEAAERGLRVGCAPDTFLGDGIQTCKDLIDSGTIGRPIAATATMMCHGHESWHPAPQFYYQPGGGPMLDMGPYYLTALVSLIGPITRVIGLSRTFSAERTIGSEPLRGQKIRVETPTHIVGIVEFASGAVAQVGMSFDVWRHSLPCIEIYGDEGSLQVPDPNGFEGTVRFARAGQSDWCEEPLHIRHPGAERGLGIRDMVVAMREGTPHRASGELGLHILEAMLALRDSGEAGEMTRLTTTVARPDSMRFLG